MWNRGAVISSASQSVVGRTGTRDWPDPTKIKPGSFHMEMVLCAALVATVKERRQQWHCSIHTAIYPTRPLPHLPTATTCPLGQNVEALERRTGARSLCSVPSLPHLSPFGCFSLFSICLEHTIVTAWDHHINRTACPGMPLRQLNNAWD